uniref:RNA methyltransferase n=1 Tax=Amblyomma aureolatum TaxID=187763 RepID=A0A1E1X5J9_9ACAR
METAVAVPGIHVDMSSKRATATAVFQRCRSVSVDRPKTLKPANGGGAESGTVLKKPVTHEEPASNQNKPPVPAGKGVYGKRRQSFGAVSDHKHLFKRRRRDLFTPPTKFLLGGNINDPLNLASFADDEVNKRANAVTPKSSPVPTPRHRTQVEVLIPPNINDPLNLNTGEDIEFKLVSPGARKRKRRYKRKSRSEDDPAADASATTPEDASSAATTSSTGATTAVAGDPESTSAATDSTMPPATPSPATPATTSRKTSSGNNAGAPAALTSSATPSTAAVASGAPAVDKIVSPVVPQGSPVKFPRRKSAGESRRSINAARSAASRQVHFRPKDAHFQYGNYNRYYGYRNGGGQEDPRLKAMKAEWFRGRDVLDIGCNVGHLTLSLARDFKPRKVIGLDIDGGLIRAARRNVRHYLTAALAGEMRFPVSMAICHGPIAAAALPGQQAESVAFPNNVFFVEGNYIVENEAQLEAQQEEFDMILCLSLTKWVHLNWGDEGVQLLFKRMYRQLRPGGRMLLEAQPFHSYAKKKKLTETTYKHYHAISLRPEQFNEYLLSPEVGFATCELVDTPSHASKGFQRPLYLFTKAGSFDESRTQAGNNSARIDDAGCAQSGAAEEPACEMQE